MHLHESVDTAGTQSRHPQEDGAVIGTVLSSPSASMHPHARPNPHTHTHNTCAHMHTAHPCAYTHATCMCMPWTWVQCTRVRTHIYIYMSPTPHLCAHVCTCARTMHVYLCEHIHAHMHTLRSARPNSPVPEPGAKQQEVV